MRKTEFLSWDDKLLIPENPTVSEGISHAGAALTDQSLDLWHPATIWSHQLDVSLFGLNPDLHHLSAIVYHLLAGLALFFCLNQIRLGSKAKSVPRSAVLITVSLFIFHPMHVESWAWLSERKDTLSAIFGFLSLGYWLKYLNQREPRFYYIALGLFALGLMSKPILVVWPAVFFISVFLNRSEKQKESLQKIVLKLLPFAALAALTVFITLSIQHADHSNKLQILQSRSFGERIYVGTNNLGLYLYKLVIPTKLSYFNVPLVAIPWKGFFASLSALIVAAIVCFRYRHTVRILSWGFCYYLILLIPVCGFIMSGEANAPDRYSYLSYLGPFLLIAIGYYQLTNRWGSLARNTLAVCIFCLLPAWFSIQRSLDWRNMETLTAATLEHSPDHPYALMHLAKEKQRKGEIEKAIALYERSLKSLPNNRYSWTTVGLLYEQLSQADKAEHAFLKQLKYRPANSTPFLALAQGALNKQDTPRAIDYLKQALELYPNDKEAKRVLDQLTSGL